MGRKGAEAARADRLGTAAKRLAGEFIPAFYRKARRFAHHAAKKAFIFQLLVRKEKGKDGKYLLNIVPFLL
jgi:hypothetical protein